mmetsp:Transcript_11690/g.39935  ORF Transcript_11690/g.39935 Transcript_11690/m.39935 type:complete len:216 (-) Transcript_11690:580-1227(-)
MMRPESRSWRTSCVSLWCVLMHSALPDTSLDADSMRSGRRVPWARYTSSALMPRSETIFWVTRMKVSPTILRFTSGDTISSRGPCFSPFTSVNAWAKSLDASRTWRSTPMPRRAASTLDDSPRRMKPWSMWRAMTRSLPKALCRSAAQTVESTPPETSTKTFLVGPTTRLISSMACSSREMTVKVPAKPQTPMRKFLSMALPCVERSTSGWNCTP